MRTFFGGQIKKECRGELAAVITREQLPKKMGVFVYSIESEEFVCLTGVYSRITPLERVYIGISSAMGGLIADRVDSFSHTTKIDIRSIDELVVQPPFLNENLEKPEKIVLVSTKDGYRVDENAR